jgi:hypothetical protein
MASGAKATKGSKIQKTNHLKLANIIIRLMTNKQRKWKAKKIPMVEIPTF